LRKYNKQKRIKFMKGCNIKDVTVTQETRTSDGREIHRGRKKMGDPRGKIIQMDIKRKN